MMLVAGFHSVGVAIVGAGCSSVPAFHQTFLAPLDEVCVAVNIGVTANISTFETTGALVARDVDRGRGIF